MLLLNKASPSQVLLIRLPNWRWLDLRLHLPSLIRPTEMHHEMNSPFGQIHVLRQVVIVFCRGVQPKKIKRSRQDKTWQGYKVVFDYFLEFGGRSYVEDIQRTDLLNFKAWLYEKKNLPPRTVRNKLSCMGTFFDVQGMPKLLEKNDMPRYVKRGVEIFEGDQLIDLYRSCPLRDRGLYDFLLMTGFREQEAQYVTWNNIRFGASIVEMRWTPQFNRSPKTYREREVSVNDPIM